MYILFNCVAACAEGFFKSSAGNDACELCGNNEVSTADRTECECMPNYAGDNCDRKNCSS